MSLADKLGNLALALGTAAAFSFGFNSDISAEEKAQPGETREEKAQPKETIEEFLQRMCNEIKSETKRKEQELVEFLQKRPIEYRDFSKIDYSLVPKEAIPLPDQFKERIESSFSGPSKPKDTKKLEKIALSEAEKLGCTIDAIKNLSAKDALKLCIDIVLQKLEYAHVDTDPKFIEEHGEHLPIEDYLGIGKGDCDKYTAALQAVFSVIKGINPNLSNIYVADKDLGGGFTVLHDWNALIFITDKNVLISHIDLQAKDDNEDLEAERGKEKDGAHLPSDDLEFKARVYSRLNLFEVSYNFHKDMLDKAAKTEDKKRILKDMAYLSCQLNDKPRMDYVRTQYQLMFPEEQANDYILYYSHKVEKSNGKPKEAQKFKDELFKRFPDSYWVKNLSKDSAKLPE